MCAVTSSADDGNGFIRGRKSGFHKAIKSKTSWLPKLQLPKGIFHRSNGNKISSDLTPPINHPAKIADGETKKIYTNLSSSKNSGCATVTQTNVESTGLRRRQNSTSSASTCYGSMSSDVSCQSQDTNKRAVQGSYTSPSMHSAQSSCDPISLWSSRRSSEVSSLERLSPTGSVRLQTLRTDISNVKDIKNIKNNSQDIVNICDKNENSASASIQKQPPVFYQCNNSRNHVKGSSDRTETSQLSNQLTRTSDINRLTPAPHVPQYFSNHDGTSNQNLDWQQSNVNEENKNIVKNGCDSNDTLDCSKDLILPDDVVNYLNEVSQQESDAENNIKICFQNQTSFQVPIKTDCCSGCKQDPYENQQFQNSCCNQNVISNQKPFYQNCASHHVNLNSPSCLSSEMSRVSCIDVQNNFNQNQSNFQPMLSNGCKNEYFAQSCNQIASQHMLNGCAQQTWNSQNIQSSGTFQSQMCSSHNVNSTPFYCNQQHYSSPPMYQVQNQYSAKSHQIQPPVLENRCPMTNCRSPQTVHIPPPYCNHQMSTQQPVFQCSVASCIDPSNNMQTKYHQIPQNYGAYHSQNSHVQNHSHFPQYHHCTNCGAGQNFPQNHCYINSLMQRNSPHQFMPPTHNVQCRSQPPISVHARSNSPSEIGNTRSSGTISKPSCNEKIDATEKQTFISAKTETSETPSTCANNVHSIAKVTTPTSVQSGGFESNVSHNVDIAPSVSQTSAQASLPTCNMVINDMNSILSSLMEETKYLR
ncbi:hypothetical protein X975_21385, partial [Stegodyphus mimosarum]